MFRYSISFLAIFFMIAVVAAYTFMHYIVREPNSTVSFFQLILIFVFGGIAGSTITLILMRAKEEKEEEKRIQ